MAGLVGLGYLAASLTGRIGLLEHTITAISKEHETEVHAPYSVAIQTGRAEGPATLDGTAWEIRLMPMAAEAAAPAQQDELAFDHRRVSSKMLATQGFSHANYTVARQPQGGLVWETVHTNPQGDMVAWRGESNGVTMRGVVTRRAPGKASEQCTFVGVSRQPAANPESQI